MILYKNKRSGRFFIYLEEIGWDQIKLVTPANQIKILERHLFGGEIEGNGKQLIETGYITALQSQKYRDYLKINQDENLQKFGTDVFQKRADDLHLGVKKNMQNNISRHKGVFTMKKIEIDDDVYAYLQNKAIPFKDINPNQVLRRLFGLGNFRIPRGQTSKKPRVISVGKKQPKTNLSVLVQAGLLKEGQTLLMKYKNEELSRKYEAEIVEDKLLYKNDLYTMSRLVAEILDREGVGIPSKSYRGPEYWYTSDGISIRLIWGRYLER